MALNYGRQTWSHQQAHQNAIQRKTWCAIGQATPAVVYVRVHVGGSPGTQSSGDWLSKVIPMIGVGGHQAVVAVTGCGNQMVANAAKKGRGERETVGYVFSSCCTGCLPSECLCCCVRVSAGPGGGGEPRSPSDPCE